MPVVHFEVQRDSYIPGLTGLLILDTLVTARVPKHDIKYNINVIMYYYICNSIYYL